MSIEVQDLRSPTAEAEKDEVKKEDKKEIERQKLYSKHCKMQLESNFWDVEKSHKTKVFKALILMILIPHHLKLAIL